jgi:hypothetical protein
MFVECDVRALTVHPNDPATLFLGTEQGLFVSRDGADFWTAVPGPLEGRQLRSVLLAGHDPKLMLVGTCPARLFGSTDGGGTWRELAADMQPNCPRIMHSRVTSLLAEPDIFWAGVEIDGVHCSQDGGRTWSCLGDGLSSRDIHALALTSERRLIATTNNDVNASSDLGRTWQPLGLPRELPWSYFRALAQPAGRPDVLLLGHGDGPPGSVGLIVRSTDAGRTWQPAQMPGTANSTIWNIATHPADPDLLYASSVSGQLYRSTDGGASWDRCRREFGEIRALAWTPA